MQAAAHRGISDMVEVSISRRGTALVKWFAHHCTVTVQHLFEHSIQPETLLQGGECAAHNATKQAHRIHVSSRGCTISGSACQEHSALCEIAVQCFAHAHLGLVWRACAAAAAAPAAVLAPAAALWFLAAMPARALAAAGWAARVAPATSSLPLVIVQAPATEG